MSIIIFIIMLAVLVLVHELGHFSVAKKFGIRVDEFGLGFPPRLIGKKIGETVYSLNSVPFGGFVKIFGEHPDEESISGTDSGRSMVKKTRLIQAAVLSAGVGGNIVFAWFLISIGFMSGLPAPIEYNGIGNAVQNPKLTVTAVLPESPAEKAGLKIGDAFLSFETSREKIENLSVEKVQNFINNSEGEISINYLRGEKNHTAVLAAKEGIISKGKAIGIGMDMIGTIKLPFGNALLEGAKTTGALVATVAAGIYRFIYNAIAGNASLSDVAGPIGIAGMVGDAEQLGFVYLISFAALISVNLAVINLIPFPALDGGRLLFLIIEAVKGSPIKPKIANALNTIGFALLILLMLVVTYHDIVKLF